MVCLNVGQYSNFRLKYANFSRGLATFYPVFIPGTLIIILPSHRNRCHSLVYGNTCLSVVAYNWLFTSRDRYKTETVLSILNRVS